MASIVGDTKSFKDVEEDRPVFGTFVAGGELLSLPVELLDRMGQEGAGASRWSPRLGPGLVPIARSAPVQSIRGQLDGHLQADPERGAEDARLRQVFLLTATRPPRTTPPLD